jgi:hypothetical protein
MSSEHKLRVLDVMRSALDVAVLGGLCCLVRLFRSHPPIDLA